MAPFPVVQDNLYKGKLPRCWIRLRFAAVDGSSYERELVADTGSPCAILLSQTDFALLLHASAASINTNFGPLAGGWFELNMPELGLTCPIGGFGSDQVFQAVQHDCPDFAGLVGLPLLRLLEYGGNGASFWVRKAVGVQVS